MGNCQAIDAASLVIQHPGGRVERLYWPVTVSEVMRMNKGHYVALVITLGASDQEEKSDNNGVRITRVKLLRPTDTLVLGQAYRLITSEEVMKGLREKKYAKLKKKEAELAEKPQTVMMTGNQSSGCETVEGRSELEKTNQVPKHERNRQGTTFTASARPKTWRPSLQSISEAAS